MAQSSKQAKGGERGTDAAGAPAPAPGEPIIEPPNAETVRRRELEEVEKRAAEAARVELRAELAKLHNEKQNELELRLASFKSELSANKEHAEIQERELRTLAERTRRDQKARSMAPS